MGINKALSLLRYFAGNLDIFGAFHWIPSAQDYGNVS